MMYAGNGAQLTQSKPAIILLLMWKIEWCLFHNSWKWGKTYDTRIIIFFIAYPGDARWRVVRQYSTFISQASTTLTWENRKLLWEKSATIKDT